MRGIAPRLAPSEEEPREGSRAQADRLAAADALLDLVGVVLLVVMAADATFASNGDGRSIVGLLFASAIALAVGRLMGRVSPLIAPIILLAVAAGVALTVLRGTGPVEALPAYANARGALFAQLAFSGLIVGVMARQRALKIVGVVAAVAFGFMAARSSTAAGFTLVLVIVAVPLVIRPRWVRPAVLSLFVLFFVFLMTTVVLGASYQAGESAGGVEGRLRATFTERRVVLWHDALTILREHPSGVGPGRFAEFSPTALADQDARWAHNEFLQEGSELGWLGFVLTFMLFTWGFARLVLHPAPDWGIVFGAVALAALGIHASVDYVLHFPVVAVVAAALLGSAQTHRGKVERGLRHRTWFRRRAIDAAESMETPRVVDAPSDLGSSSLMELAVAPLHGSSRTQPIRPSERGSRLL